MALLILGFLKKAAIVLVAFYFGIHLLLYLLQNRLLFPAPDTQDVGLIPSAERSTQQTSDGETLQHLRFRGEPTAPKLMFFHGNGDAALLSQDLGAHFQAAGFDVLLVEYRGYGGSSGKPSAEKLLSDALETHDWFAEGGDQPVFLLAQSLGTGMAAFLASKRNVSGIVLLSPYNSLEEVAALHYPYFFVKPLFRNRIHSSTYLASGSTPILVIHGEKDRVIPIELGRDLFDKAGASDKHWITLPEAGHNDVFRPETIQQIMSFFRARL